MAPLPGSGGLRDGRGAENNASIVFRIQYGTQSILFMGDAEGKDRGSETSGTDPFIAAVSPAYVVVSSGRKKFKSRFLPDRTTLQRYCSHNDSTRIYRTDQEDEGEGRTETTDADGDHISLSMNGKETRVQAYSAGNPITPTACVS